jgi:hypothetical protein
VRSNRRRNSCRGQVALEAALALPLVLALGLGVLQLGLIQQARLMVEYAAFAAARAGIVWGGNNERMHDAALIAVLPTLGRTDQMESFGATWAHARHRDLEMHRWLRAARSEGAPFSLETAGLLGLVRVDLVSPTGKPRSRTGGEAPGGAGWRELDFDGQELRPEDVVLSVRVRYLFELRIPFAGWMIFTAWYAASAEDALGIHPQRGFGLTSREMELLLDLSRRGRTFLPLFATYSLPMQSNVQRKWLVHESPRWTP